MFPQKGARSLQLMFLCPSVLVQTQQTFSRSAGGATSGVKSSDVVKRHVVSVAECEFVRPQQNSPSQNTRFYCDVVVGQNLKLL